MKRNKLFMFLVLVLVFALAMSVLLVGCDKDKKDKDDDEDEESKPKAEEIFKGVDTTDFDAVKTRLFEKIDGANFTVVVKIIEQSATHTTTLKVTDKAMHIAREQGEEVYDSYICLEKGKSYYYESSEDKGYIKSQGDDGDFEFGLKSQIAGSKTYIEAFTSSDVTYDEETKVFSNDVIRVKVEKTSVVINKQYSNYAEEITFKDFGATRVKLPSKYTEEAEPEVADIWGDVDRTDYKAVRARLDEILATCTSIKSYDYEIDMDAHGYMIADGRDGYVSSKFEGSPLYENYFTHATLNGKDIFATFAPTETGWVYSLDAYSESEIAEYLGNIKEFATYWIDDSFGMTTVTYDANKGGFVADINGNVCVMTLTPDGYKVEAANGDKLEICEINTAKVPELPKEALDNPTQLNSQDFPNVF